MTEPKSMAGAMQTYLAALNDPGLSATDRQRAGRQFVDDMQTASDQLLSRSQQAIEQAIDARVDARVDERLRALGLLAGGGTIRIRDTGLLSEMRQFTEMVRNFDAHLASEGTPESEWAKGIDRSRRNHAHALQQLRDSQIDERLRALGLLPECPEEGSALHVS